MGLTENAVPKNMFDIISIHFIIAIIMFLIETVI